MLFSGRSLLFSACLNLHIGYVRAQCGPGGAKPYPPGSSTCPDVADGSAPHNSGNVAPAPAPAPSGAGSSGTCSTPPCAAALLGDVGFTTVAGTESFSGATFPIGENIYGPFEAGFSSAQDSILARLGCTTGHGYIQGGVDTELAEMVTAFDCGVTLPRMEGGRYIALLDQCGGHTVEYHFHQKMTCLYKFPSGGHSAQVGKALDMQPIYGKYEDDRTNILPKLDACGGHFGVTPNSGGKVVYHYHVQDKAPHTIGCFGPDVAADGGYTLVTLARCRSLYSGCEDGDTITLATAAGNVQYDPWCPCFDETGSNVGTTERAVFSSGEATSCSGDSCVGFEAVSASEGTPQIGGEAQTFNLTVLIACVLGALCLGGLCVAAICLFGTTKKRGAYVVASEEEETGDELY